jgi:hypothetical protein
MERYRPSENIEKKDNKIKVFLGSIVNFIVNVTDAMIKQLAGRQEKQTAS